MGAADDGDDDGRPSPGVDGDSDPSPSRRRQRRDRRRQNRQEVLKSWLKARLPLLPLSDLQSYVERLYDDGFISAEELNTINAAEDFRFMKKGHRRMLLRKLREEGWDEISGKVIVRCGRASLPYQRLQLEQHEQQRWQRGVRSEMMYDKRLPPPVPQREALDRHSCLDVTSRFPADRPSSLVNTVTGTGRLASGWYVEGTFSRSDDAEDARLDLTRNFPKGRPSSLVNTGVNKQDLAAAGTREENEVGSQKAHSRNSGDGSYLDISRNFPEERPSTLVNTGAKRRKMTAAGTYHEEEEHCTRNIAQSNFSTDLASLRDHPPIREIDGVGGLRGAADEEYSDGLRSRDAAQGKFSRDLASLRGYSPIKKIEEVSGSKGGDANYGYLDEPLFSPDLAPHSMDAAAGVSTEAVWRGFSYAAREKDEEKYVDTPPAFARDIDMSPPEYPKADRFAAMGSGVADGYLDTNSFSANLRYSTAAAEDSPRKETVTAEGLEFLDTPRPFQPGVDMTSSNMSGALVKQVPRYDGEGTDEYLNKNPFSTNLRYSEKPAEDTQIKTAAGTVTEQQQFLDTPRPFQSNVEMRTSNTSGSPAKQVPGHLGAKEDEYLDTNPFSVNLRYSTTAVEELQKKKATTGGHQFLDIPRAFWSNVEMRTSNTSGARHRRSSDAPPEERNIRDYFDVTTAPMSDIGEMRSTKISRKMAVASSLRAAEPAEAEVLFKDITRAPMSTLERTTSVIKDANSASKARSRGMTPPPAPSVALGRASFVVKDANSAPKVRLSGEALPASSDRDDAQSAGNGDDVWSDGTHPAGSGNVGASGDSFRELDPYEHVMHWLLTYLPQLQEEDAVSYFNHLVEDGFDSADNLSALVERDLHFMKKGHRRALLRALKNINEDADANKNKSSMNEVCQDEETMAWIAAQNQTLEDRPALRLEEEAAARASHEENLVSEGEGYQGDAQGEPFADITHSKFVNRPSLSLAAPHSSFTRDLFPDRPSLASHFSSQPPMNNRGNSMKSSLGGGNVLKDNAPSMDRTPKAELHRWYIENGSNKGAQISNDHFTTFADDNLNESKFTSIFTCPMTGEHFACGSWRNDGEAAEARDRIFWYKNKKQAMNAAAARALDCFSLRTEVAPTQRCDDLPYLSRDDAPSLPTLPTGISLPSLPLKAVLTKTKGHR